VNRQDKQFQKMINGYYIHDYTSGKTELINDKIKHLFVSMTLEEAGALQSEKVESIVTVELPEAIKGIIKTLLKDKVIQINGKFVVCETAPSEKNKVFE
jgi:hypothetical protein